MATAAAPQDTSPTSDSPAAASNESRESQPSDEEPPPTEEVEVEVYSLFNTPLHKLIIFTLLSLATLTSPLTATIYLPLLPLLSQHYAVSPQRINLTITIYIIFQALSPLLLSTPSDTLGRRPLFLLTFAIYTLASILLAIIRSNFAALLTLRALQSLGASAVLSVVYGTVSDVYVPSERGKVLGPVMAAANLGTAIGPLVGGWIALSSGSVWWVFWTLAIFGAFMLVSLGALLPETARNVVGNGGIKDKAWNRPLLDLNRWSRSRTPACSTIRTTTDGGRSTRSLKFRNPLMSIRIMAHPDTAIILWIVATFYALWYIVQASIPSVYRQHPFNFNEFQTGLAYLTGAAGVIICMYATGKAMDYNYRVIARRMNFPIDKVKGDDLSRFPIEKARGRGCTWLLLASLAVSVGYGWAIEKHAHVAVPLTLQLLMGFLATWILNCFNALLVDGFPQMPSTAATAGNMVRCGMSAGAVAALQPLTQAIGRGWVFTLAGILTGVGGLVGVVVLNHKGLDWRNRRNKSISTGEESKVATSQEEHPQQDLMDTEKR
ncbi:hypothetical protein LTR11_006234 [Exophiala xenobiotica]|nr:hypothetical protein LTR11_006234 [Exophiala xenobiotica]